MYKRSATQFFFKDAEAEFCCVLKEQLKLLQSIVTQWKSGKECEIICELADMNDDHTIHIEHLKRIRIIEQKAKFAGKH